MTQHSHHRLIQRRDLVWSAGGLQHFSLIFLIIIFVCQCLICRVQIRCQETIRARLKKGSGLTPPHLDGFMALHSYSPLSLTTLSLLLLETMSFLQDSNYNNSNEHQDNMNLSYLLTSKSPAHLYPQLDGQRIPPRR